MNFRTYIRAALAPFVVGVIGMYLIESLNLDDSFGVIISTIVPIVTFFWLFHILAKELLSNSTQKLLPNKDTGLIKLKGLRVVLWIIFGIIILGLVIIIGRLFFTSFALPI